MPVYRATKCMCGKDSFLWLRAAIIDQYGSWRKQLTTFRLRPWLPIECRVLDDRRTCKASIFRKSPTKAVMAHFLKVLVSASEKSANIARACRYEDDLFQLLIQEKKSDEMNRRFFQDFKTLADVLIQETVRHDIGKEFPEIADYIKGEENNTFTNTLGESITVEVKECPGDTSSMLCKVLDGNENAANLLAAEVHKEIHLEEDFSELSDCPQLPISQLGIWIDPIDSTAEYISGGSVPPAESTQGSPTSIHQWGLPCVTVLIGAFHRQTGTPVVGVVNRPFSTEDSTTGMWTGKYYWGISYEDYRMSSIAVSNAQEEQEKGPVVGAGGMRMVELSVEGRGSTNPPEGGDAGRGPKNSRGVVVVSGSESEALRQRLSTRYTVVEAPGAGHKQLCVALGEADAYLLTRSTTFRWDACGPHALLSSLGGGVVDCRRVTNAAADSCPLPPSHLLDCPGLKEALPFMLDLELRFGLRYNEEEEHGTGGETAGTNNSPAKWCNRGGIIAYRSPRFLLQLVGTIRQPAGAITSPA